LPTYQGVCRTHTHRGSFTLLSNDRRYALRGHAEATGGGGSGRRGRKWQEGAEATGRGGSYRRGGGDRGGR